MMLPTWALLAVPAGFGVIGLWMACGTPRIGPLTGDGMRILARLLILVIAIPALAVQSGKSTALDPALAQLVAAKKVFISNLGEDTIEWTFNPGWSDDRIDPPYNYLYAAMQNWGLYQLVLVPADADLIFEVEYSDPVTYDYSTKPRNEPIPHPQLTLTVRDPATHGVIKEFMEKFNWAILPSNREKDFAQATVNLLNDMAQALGRPRTVFTLPKKIPDGPVPPQILAAKTVFISRPAPDRVHGDPVQDEQLYERVVAATRTWGQLEIVATAQAADIIWQPSVCDGNLRMTITDPKTQILLWGLTAVVKHSLFDIDAQKHVDDATVALLNHASQLAGKVTFSTGLAADKILAPAMDVPTQVTISGPATAKAGSDVRVHVTLKNTTSADLDFEYSDGDPLTCIVAVRDANGNAVADTAQGTKLKAEHSSWQGQKVSYALHPGETQTRDCPVSELYDMSAPMKYSIQVQQLDGHVVQSNMVNVMIAP